MKKHTAFTLTQMLVTVAVGSLLIVALLPVLQSDHATLQRAICANNLREIGQAITLYAADNNDCLPPGYQQSPSSDWHLIVTPYLGKSQTAYASGGTQSAVFLCPASATPPAGTTVSLTYTAHRAMFWCEPACNINGNTIVQYKMSQCSRPGEVAMVFDGCQQSVDAPTTFDAQACSDELPDTLIVYPGTRPNQAEPVGANADGPSGVGLIRWRHSNNSGANFLMVDGHVNSLLVGQLLRRDLYYDK